MSPNVTKIVFVLGTLILSLALSSCTPETSAPEPSPEGEPRAALTLVPPGAGEWSAERDAELGERIESRFRLHRRLVGLPIHVIVVDRTALLLGVVPTDVEKILAGRLTSDTLDVNSVDNQLSIIPTESISPPPRELRIDAALREDAERALKLSQTLMDAAIDVSVYRQTARLVGVVGDEGERVFAEELVGGVPGIQWVKNGLIVQSNGRVVP